MNRAARKQAQLRLAGLGIIEFRVFVDNLLSELYSSTFFFFF
jgi:hypothetical protein